MPRFSHYPSYNYARFTPIGQDDIARLRTPPHSVPPDNTLSPIADAACNFMHLNAAWRDLFGVNISSTGSRYQRVVVLPCCHPEYLLMLLDILYLPTHNLHVSTSSILVLVHLHHHDCPKSSIYTFPHICHHCNSRTTSPPPPSLYFCLFIFNVYIIPNLCCRTCMLPSTTIPLYATPTILHLHHICCHHNTSHL